VVYGIRVQREEKGMSVWYKSVSNPVINEYPGRKELLDIHTGFSLYMLRQKKRYRLRRLRKRLILLSEGRLGKSLVYFPMC